VPLIERWQGVRVGERMTLRAQFLLERSRGQLAKARALADSASQWFAGEATWYLRYRQ
jgi:hypothetical protein